VNLCGYLLRGPDVTDEGPKAEPCTAVPVIKGKHAHMCMQSLVFMAELYSKEGPGKAFAWNITIIGNNWHVRVGRTLSYRFIIPFRSPSKELTGARCDTAQKLSQDTFDAGSSFTFCFAADETPSYSVVTAEVRIVAYFTSLGGFHPPEGMNPWVVAIM
jgi:hypothetical protein